MAEAGGISRDEVWQLDDERRLRGRLCSPVTVWTSGSATRRSGLTISATIVAAQPARSVLGMVGGRSRLWSTLQNEGRFVVHVLEDDHVDLAHRFAHPGDGQDSAFADEPFQESEYGPVLSAVGTRAYCRFEECWPIGHQYLVRGAIEQLALSDMTRPLIHFRGEFGTLAPRLAASRSSL